MTARLFRTVPGPCQKLRGKTIELSSFWLREISAAVLGMNNFFLGFMCPTYRLFRSHGGWLRWIISSDQVLVFWFFKNLVTFYKSDNLQYDTLGRWVAGTNDSSNKRLMFQVLFFFQNFLHDSLQKSFQFIFLFFII